MPSDARRGGRWPPAACRRAARCRRRTRARSRRRRAAPPSRAARGAARRRRRSSTRPSASPSGAGSRGSTWLHALDQRHRGAEPAQRLRHLDAHRPAAEHEQPPRHLLHAGRLAVRPDAVELAQARDRRHDGIGARREDDVGGVVPSPSTTTRPGPAIRPSPRSRSMPGVLGPLDLARIGVVGDHVVAPGERLRGVDAPPTASRGAGRLARRLQRLARAQQRLRRDAAPSTSIRRRAARARRSRPAGRPRRAGRRSARRPARRR